MLKKRLFIIGLILAQLGSARDVIETFFYNTLRQKMITRLQKIIENITLNISLLAYGISYITNDLRNGKPLKFIQPS